MTATQKQQQTLPSFYSHLCLTTLNSIAIALFAQIERLFVQTQTTQTRKRISYGGSQLFDKRRHSDIFDLNKKVCFFREDVFCHLHFVNKVLKFCGNLTQLHLQSAVVGITRNCAWNNEKCVRLREPDFTRIPSPVCCTHQTHQKKRIVPVKLA